MKKVAIFLMSFALCMCIIFLGLYKTDMNRMYNNEPVVFSTWGYEYAPPVDQSEIIENETLYMKADEKTITTRGIVIEIVNNSDHDVAFGDYYSIERNYGELWQELSCKNSVKPDWNDMGYIIGSKGSAEFNFYWVDLYGELEPGSYRLEKLYIDGPMGNEINHLYCYFTI